MKRSCAASDLRLARVRRKMKVEGIEVLFLRDTSNIAWLTAFDDVFDDERAHAVVVTPDSCVLHTDSRYASACRAAAQGSQVEVDDMRAGHAAWLAQRYPDVPHVAIEDDMPLLEFRALERAWQGGAPSLRETSGFGVSLRAVKDSYEVERLVAAQAVTDAAFNHIVSFMKPGMTERMVQIELEDYMTRHGARGLAFSSIVATGANGARPHAIPGNTRLEAGQCVVMDFGARALGYCSDMTRTVFLGEPSAQLAHAYEVLRSANEQVEAMIRPGVTGAQAHQLAEDVLAEGGYAGAMGHGLGHGVGIDIHERPVLSPRNDKPLEAGNVVTVEPGIYIEGEFGMRLEDFGLVTHDGFRVFTQSTHDLVII